jgi:signal transduction protein with GAF and PtsI domain
MLGDHGVRFSLKHKDIMEAELLAAKEVADDFPDKHIGIMMPQVISVSELKETKELAKKVGVPKNVKIGIMVETPAAVQIIDLLCEEGVDFISFGTNDLTQFTLAIDRNNPEVQNIYDETHPAVLRSLKHVIEVCKKYKVETSICGQAGSRPEMVKHLFAFGISSVSVNADAAHEISKVIAEMEGSAPVESVIDPFEADSLDESGPEVDSEVLDEEKEILEESETPNIAKSEGGVFEEEDMEEAILRELDSDSYDPGLDRGRNSDVPPLNDAVTVGSELFEDSNELGDEIELN